MDCGPDVRDSITMSACFLQKRKIQNRLVEDMIWKASHVFQYSFTHSRNFLYKGRRKKNKKHQFAITVIRTVYIGSLKPVSSDEGMKRSILPARITLQPSSDDADPCIRNLQK